MRRSFCSLVLVLFFSVFTWQKNMMACFVSSQFGGKFYWIVKSKVLGALVFYLTPSFTQLHLHSLPLVLFSYLFIVKFFVALHAFKPPSIISGI